MSQYQNILKSFNEQTKLNSKIWYDKNEMSLTDKNVGNVSMKPEIRKRLLEIAEEFIVYIKMEFFLTNVVMTGSLCNFNWSEFSDVDLHVYVDFSQFDKEDIEVYKELFSIKKTLFNTQHDIKIKGYDVELYIEDINEQHYSSGIYSILFNEWINEPKRQQINFDKNILNKKVNSWIEQIDLLIDKNQDEEKEIAKNRIEKLQDSLKKYRTIGLKKGGEYSYENLVFKFLRRNGYLEKLFNFKNDVIDKNLSLKETRKY